MRPYIVLTEDLQDFIISCLRKSNLLRTLLRSIMQPPFLLSCPCSFWERKSTTLQHMFTDCLEVEENLKMSKNSSYQDSGGEIKDTFKLVGPYKKNGKVPIHLKLSLGIQKDDQPDIGAYGSAGLFSEDCNLLSTGSIKDDFKKDFGVPVYDEYEEEYLGAMPKQPVIEPRFANGENQAAMQSQKVGIGKDDKCAEGDSLPLCYSSFELVQHMFKASKKK